MGVLAMDRKLTKGRDHCEQQVLPSPFLSEIRRALDSGLTPRQVDSMLNLMMMMCGLMDIFDPEVLAERCSRIVAVVAGDKALHDSD